MIPLFLQKTIIGQVTAAQAPYLDFILGNCVQNKPSSCLTSRLEKAALPYLSVRSEESIESHFASSVSILFF